MIVVGYQFQSYDWNPLASPVNWQHTLLRRMYYGYQHPRFRCSYRLHCQCKPNRLNHQGVKFKTFSISIQFKLQFIGLHLVVVFMAQVILVMKMLSLLEALHHSKLLKRLFQGTMTLGILRFFLKSKKMRSNSSWKGRRYYFSNQPDVGLWNIAQFIPTLSSANLINENEADYALERYGTKFMDDYKAVMTKKLGLAKYNKQLISNLLNNMAVDKVDYTNFFRLLSNIKANLTTPDEELLVPLKPALL